MKFMLTYEIHDDKRQEALKTFSGMTADDDKADLGDNVKLIGRWHDLSRMCGVAICEADSAADVASFALNWNSICDIETVPVLDDEEARAVGRKKLG